MEPSFFLKKNISQAHRIKKPYIRDSPLFPTKGPAAKMDPFGVELEHYTSQLKEKESSRVCVKQARCACRPSLIIGNGRLNIGFESLKLFF